MKKKMLIEVYYYLRTHAEILILLKYKYLYVYFVLYLSPDFDLSLDFVTMYVVVDKFSCLSY